jgi:iron complex transport system substrate-binding protein
MRIVSLLPSATEIVFALGLDDHLVGVTFECDHPPAAREKRIVSTTSLPEGLSPAEIDAAVKERIASGEDLYHLDRAAFEGLDATHVLTQDLCAVCALDVADVDDALAYLGCTADVVTLDPATLDDVLATITTVGRVTGATDRAAEVVASLRARLDAVRAAVDGTDRRSTLVLEWTDPAFTAGHWVPNLVTTAGGLPVLAHAGGKSTGVEWDVVRTAPAEVVVVAPCGFGLDAADELARGVIAADRVPAGAEVWAIDADGLIVRPGPRLVDGVEALAAVLHPDRVGPPPPTAARRIR